MRKPTLACICLAALLASFAAPLDAAAGVCVAQPAIVARPPIVTRPVPVPVTRPAAPAPR